MTTNTAIEQVQDLIKSGVPEVEAIEQICYEWRLDVMERLILTNCVANLKEHERRKSA